MIRFVDDDDKIIFKEPKDVVVVPSGMPYKGDYVVTPTTEEQTLRTRYKTMLDDVKVKKIPRSDVVNLKGGLTVTIGGNI